MIRHATPADLPALADLWHQGWHEAHAAHVPADLTAQRSRDSLLAQLQMQPVLLTAGNPPLGLCIPRGNEIYQMYVAPAARGTGTAAALIRAGEDHIRAAGFNTARLDVIPQNRCAIAFYEKCGWQRGEIQTVMLDTLADPFPLNCVVMTKNLNTVD